MPHAYPEAGNRVKPSRPERPARPSGGASGAEPEAVDGRGRARPGGVPGKRGRLRTAARPADDAGLRIDAAGPQGGRKAVAVARAARSPTGAQGAGGRLSMATGSISPAGRNPNTRP